jgi:hypothetical protein
MSRDQQIRARQPKFDARLLVAIFLLIRVAILAYTQFVSESIVAPATRPRPSSAWQRAKQAGGYNTRDIIPSSSADKALIR